ETVVLCCGSASPTLEVNLDVEPLGAHCWGPAAMAEAGGGEAGPMARCRAQRKRGSGRERGSEKPGPSPASSIQHPARTAVRCSAATTQLMLHEANSSPDTVQVDAGLAAPLQRTDLNVPGWPAILIETCSSAPMGGLWPHLPSQHGQRS